MFNTLEDIRRTDVGKVRRALHFGTGVLIAAVVFGALVVTVMLGS